MSDYTTKERHEIDRAFTVLRRLVESDTKADMMLDEAYKCERRERGSQTATQALLVESFLDGWMHDQLPASRIYGYAKGCGIAAVLGATARDYRRRSQEENSEQYRFNLTESEEALLKGAKETYRKASHRRIDRIMAR